MSSPVTGAQPRDATIAYPGGLRARWRWGGSGQGAAVFALSEAGGTLADHGPLVSADYEALCRAELRIDGPGGAVDGEVRIDDLRRAGRTRLG